MSSFKKTHCFKVSSSSSLTKWVSTTGLTIIHFDETRSKLKGQIIVDTRSGESYQAALLLDVEFHRAIDHLNESGKHRWTNYTSDIELDSSTYTLQSYGWQTFMSSLEFYLEYIVNRELEEKYPGELSRSYHHYAQSYTNGSRTINLTKSYRNSAIYENTPLAPVSPELKCANLALDSIKQFRAKTHQPQNITIVVRGKVSEQELLSTISNLEQQCFGSHWSGSKIERKRIFPHGKVIDVDTFHKYGKYEISWDLKQVTDPLHFMAICVLKSFYRHRCVRFVQFDDSVGSTFTFSSYLVGKLQEMIDSFKNGPRYNDSDLKKLKEYVSNQILEPSFSPQQEVWDDYIKSGFMNEQGDLSSFKLWADGRQQSTKLLSWNSSDWSAMVTQYIVIKEPLRVNLHPSKTLQNLSNSIHRRLTSEVKGMFVRTGSHDWRREIVANIPDIIEPRDIDYPKSRSYRNAAGPFLETIDYVKDDPLSEAISSDSIDIPLIIHLEDFDFEVTTIFLSIDKSRLDLYQLTLIPFLVRLYNNWFMQEPYSKVLDFQFKARSSGTGTYFWPQNVETLRISFLPENYGKCIDWLSKFLNSISERKLRASEMDVATMMWSEKRELKLLQRTGLSELRDLAKNLFRLENFKVFVMGNVGKLSHPVSAWKGFAQSFAANEEKYFGGLTFDPIIKSKTKTVDSFYDYSIPELGKAILVEKKNRDSSLDPKSSRTIYFTPLDCDESQHSKILFCMKQHWFYPAPYSFSIYRNHLVLEMTKDESDSSIVFFDREDLARHSEIVTRFFSEGKRRDLNRMRRSTAYEGALLKMECVFDYIDPNKADNFFKLASELMVGDTIKTTVEYTYRLFDPSISSMITTLDSTNSFPLLEGYGLTPESEALVSELGASVRIVTKKREEARTHFALPKEAAYFQEDEESE